MTVVDIYRRVRRYGLNGVILWARVKWGNCKLRLWLRWNAIRHPLKPSPGITMLAGLSGADSCGKVLRDLAFSIHDAGVPLQVFPAAATDPDGRGIMRLLTPLKDFQIRRHPLLIELFDGVTPEGLVPDQAHLAFWEFEDGFLPVYPKFASLSHVVAISDFNAEVFRRELPASVKVSKLLYPFRPHTGNLPSRQSIRERFGLPQDAFVVFFNFDFGSGFGRKNPDGAMRAFADAFKDDANAWLVFKTMRSGQNPQRVAALSRLADELGIAARFKMIHDYLSNDDIYGLTAASDAYLSLHRGEGFGLGIAEAMSLGVPVVVSNYSAPTEFCKPDNSLLVPCRIVPVPKTQDHPTYAYVTRWADPDVAVAADALRRLKADPQFAQNLGQVAKDFIADYFSIANFRASLEKLTRG